MPEDFQEKTEPATPRKLEQARKKGQVAKSQELNGAVLLLSEILVLYFCKEYMLTKYSHLFTASFRHLNEPIDQIETISYWMKQWIGYGLLMIAPMLLVGFVLAGSINAFQVGFCISFESLKPKWEKFNIFDPQNYKRFFNARILARTFLGISKITFLALISYWITVPMFVYLGDLITSDAHIIFAFMMERGFFLFLVAALFLLFLSILDTAFQKWKFLDEMKMSKQEIKEEQKQLEGDPKIKSRFRTMMQEMSRNRTKAHVPKANVVIANPTHFAVALRYDEATMTSPICVAKGRQNMALFIKQLAKEHRVPIVENPPLARSLYHAVNIGQFIPSEFYHAVAEVLAYVYRMNQQLAGAPPSSQ